MDNENLEGSSISAFVEGQNEGVLPNVVETDDAGAPNVEVAESSGLGQFPEDTTETESSACSSVETELTRSSSSSEHESEANDGPMPSNRRRVLRGGRRRHLSVSQKLAKNKACNASTEESSSSVDSKKTGENYQQPFLSGACGGPLDDAPSSKPRDDPYYGSLEETQSSETLNEAFSIVSLEKSSVPMDENSSSMSLEKNDVPMDETPSVVSLEKSDVSMDETPSVVSLEKSDVSIDETPSSLPQEKRSEPLETPSSVLEETQSSGFHTEDSSSITFKERLSLEPDQPHDTSTGECHEQQENKNSLISESKNVPETKNDTDVSPTKENIVPVAASTCSASMGSNETSEDALNLTQGSKKRTRVTDAENTMNDEWDAKRKKLD